MGVEQGYELFTAINQHVTKRFTKAWNLNRSVPTNGKRIRNMDLDMWSLCTYLASTTVTKRKETTRPRSTWGDKIRVGVQEIGLG